MQTTLVKNNTPTSILLTCSESGALLYLHGFGSITYPNLDLDAEDVRGLLDAEFKMVSDGHHDPEIKNDSDTRVLCVQGRVGTAVVPTTFLPPQGSLDLAPYNVVVDVDGLPAGSTGPAKTFPLFAGTHEFFIPKAALQRLDKFNDMIALAVQKPQDGTTLTTFLLSRQRHPEQFGATFEISCTSSALVPLGPECTVSCKTLPNVSLCASTKASVGLLVTATILLLVALVAMPLYVVACRKADARK